MNEGDEIASAKARLDELLEQIDEKQEIVDAYEKKLEQLKQKDDAGPSHKVSFKTDSDQSGSSQINEDVQKKRHEISAERRAQHAKIEKLMHEKRKLDEQIAASKEKISEIEQELEAKQRVLSNSKEILSLVANRRTSKQLQAIIDRINHTEAEIERADSRMAELDIERGKLSSEEKRIAKLQDKAEKITSKLGSMRSKYEGLKERNDEMESQIATLISRYRRLAPLAMKFKDQRLLHEETEEMEAKSIDELLNIIGARNARIIEYKGKARAQIDKVEELRQEYDRELAQFIDVEKSLIDEIEKQRQKSSDVEKSLVDDIERLRIRCAQQEIRRKARGNT